VRQQLLNHVIVEDYCAVSYGRDILLNCLRTPTKRMGFEESTLSRAPTAPTCPYPKRAKGAIFVGLKVSSGDGPDWTDATSRMRIVDLHTWLMPRHQKGVYCSVTNELWWLRSIA
jgi:hypothetical protein